MRAYTLLITYTSGDEVRATTHNRENIIHWLMKLNVVSQKVRWSVVQPIYEGHKRVGVNDITKEIEIEYKNNVDALLLQWARNRNSKRKDKRYESITDESI